MELEDRFFREPNPFNPEGTVSEEGPEGSFAFDLTAQGEAPRLEPAGGRGAIVRAFTDLKRHDLNDADYQHFANELLPQGTLFGNASADDFYNVPARSDRPTRAFLTRKLWDAGNSDPYGHRGDLTMMTEAIHFHGGEARGSRDRYFSLPSSGRDAIIEFLWSLRVLPPRSALVVQASQDSPQLKADAR